MAPNEQRLVASLKIEVPGRSNSEITLSPGKLTIGRHPLNLLCLDDSNCSRFHAEIIVRDGRVVVKDLGSSNGVRVNGARVKSAELADGDTIVLGASVLKLAIGRPISDSSSEVELLMGDEVTGKPTVSRKVGASSDKLIHVGEAQGPAELQRRLRAITDLHKTYLGARTADDLVREGAQTVFNCLPFQRACLLEYIAQTGEYQPRIVVNRSGREGDK